MEDKTDGHSIEPRPMKVRHVEMKSSKKATGVLCLLVVQPHTNRMLSNGPKSLEPRFPQRMKRLPCDLGSRGRYAEWRRLSRRPRYLGGLPCLEDHESSRCVVQIVVKMTCFSKAPRTRPSRHCESPSGHLLHHHRRVPLRSFDVSRVKEQCRA